MHTKTNEVIDMLHWEEFLTGSMILTPYILENKTQPPA